MARDYYATLGVARGASEKEIRKAYRKLARETHPDVNRDDPRAESRFKEVQEAYRVLSDPEQRRQYDQFGADFEQFQQGAGPNGGFRTTSQDINLGDLGDLFGDLFTSRRGRQAGAGPGAGWFGRGGGAAPPPSRGADVEVVVEVGLEEVESGLQRDLSVTVRDAAGGSRVERLKGLKIPAGVADGDVIRVAGKGGRGPGGAGDLLLKVALRPHPFFVRQGDDLECEVPISVAEAALGGEIEVPTLQGMRPLRLPAGTQGGRRLRIRGAGLPNRKTGQRGNLLVRVRITVPTELTPAERAALTSAAERAGDPRRDLWRPAGS